MVSFHPLGHSALDIVGNGIGVSRRGRELGDLGLKGFHVKDVDLLHQGDHVRGSDVVVQQFTHPTANTRRAAVPGNDVTARQIRDAVTGSLTSLAGLTIPHTSRPTGPGSSSRCIRGPASQITSRGVLLIAVQTPLLGEGIEHRLWVVGDLLTRDQALVQRQVAELLVQVGHRQLGHRSFPVIDIAESVARHFFTSAFSPSR